MRYGTVPVVRRIGGLQDTVIDYEDEGGYGVCFKHASVEDMMHGFSRSLQLYNDKKKMKEVRKLMTGVKTSWNSSAKKYIELYKSI
jgi:starch synthase